MALIDWVERLKPMAKAGWDWGLDGKFDIRVYVQPIDTPWVHNPIRIPGSVEEGLDCGLLTIYHNHVFRQQAAHSFCMECYKVVVALKSLEQVHKMVDWQQSECVDNGWACKAGAERRPYTQRVWGAYFYCRGVEEGRERYKAVRKWVDENLGEDVHVFLKRACTEFEQHLGNSDKWEMLPYQLEIEEEGKQIFGYKPNTEPQSSAIQHHVYNIWDAWDRDNQPPVTYHDEGE